MKSAEQWIEEMWNETHYGEPSLPMKDRIKLIQADATADLQSQVEQLRGELDAARKSLRKCRCIYCDFEAPFEEKEKLADHIMSCEKSPVVQMVKEMESRMTDYMDLMMDEFARISTITRNTEIVGICQRAMLVIHQREPVIKQRDNAQAQNGHLRTALEKCVVSLERVLEIEEMGYTPDDPGSESGVSVCDKCEGVQHHNHKSHAENCPQPIIEDALATAKPLLNKP